MANWWFYGFWIVYAMFIFTLYKAYLSKLVNRLRFGNRFVHYHILDTGEYGDKVFRDGENEIDGTKRIYVSEKVLRGTLFYEEKNPEPLAVKRDIKSYKYYCDSKNYDTVARNDLLQTLMILNAKELLMLLIGVSIVVSAIGIVATWYFTNTMHTDLNNAIEGLKTLNQSGIVIGKKS